MIVFITLRLCKKSVPTWNFEITRPCRLIKQTVNGPFYTLLVVWEFNDTTASLKCFPDEDGAEYAKTQPRCTSGKQHHLPVFKGRKQTHMLRFINSHKNNTPVSVHYVYLAMRSCGHADKLGLVLYYNSMVNKLSKSQSNGRNASETR